MGLDSTQNHSRIVSTFLPCVPRPHVQRDGHPRCQFSWLPSHREAYARASQVDTSNQAAASIGSLQEGDLPRSLTALYSVGLKALRRLGRSNA